VTRSRSSRKAAYALALAILSLGDPVSAAAVLRSAEVVVTVPSPARCDVSMTLAVDGGTGLDHRLETPEGTEVAGLRISGARQDGEPRTIGRTRSVVLTPEQPAYTISYRVQQGGARRDRCPLWLPVAPADGVSRQVRLRVELPPGTAPGHTMPRFTWSGSTGTATLGHLPAFILIPYGPSGESTWNISTAMDASAIAVFVAASGIWAWRRKGRVGPAGRGDSRRSD
jgi:hypothetical protein